MWVRRERTRKQECDTSWAASGAQNHWMGWVSQMRLELVSESVGMARGAGREPGMGVGGQRDARGGYCYCYW